mmetsp:Transcript_20720/g.31779  ORF Transcript_20720/g.31779 Transcript_20720/m.31779 type:complete len:95 (+) Transcript_20720:307-591(+)
MAKTKEKKGPLSKKSEMEVTKSFYGKVLGNPSLILPSLFDDRVARAVLPEEEIISTRSGLSKMKSPKSHLATSPFKDTMLSLPSPSGEKSVAQI